MMGGYRVDITITAATNISPKIFVFQREVAAPANPDTYLDTFYTVASVEQMASVPEVQVPSESFYRSDSISLVFATAEELNHYADKIIKMISVLKKANDLAINMLTPVTASIP
jgi:hypothetical protein